MSQIREIYVHRKFASAARTKQRQHFNFKIGQQATLEHILENRSQRQLS